MLFKNINYFGKDFKFHKGTLSVEKGKIKKILDTGFPTKGTDFLIPGLVDLHCHGNSGVDFSDGEYKGITKMARYLIKNGITSFSPASITMSEFELEKAYRAAAKFKKKASQNMAKLQGITMEGPFFSKKYKGAQCGKKLKLPDKFFFERLNISAEGLIKIVCIAPELKGSNSFIESVSCKTVISIAHTASDYKTAAKAIKLGARHITHLFNAMPPMLHRAPGVIAAAMEEDSVTVELICDGIHVHESIVRAVFRMFGEERVVLISDSVRACGMPDGEYMLGGQKIKKIDNIAILQDGTFAGSVINLFECMKKAISFGIPKEIALRAATYNPAVVLGIQNEVGSIEVGKCADLILCDPDFSIKKVYLNGKPVV